MGEPRDESTSGFRTPPRNNPNQPPGTLDMTTGVANAYQTNTHIRRDLVETVFRRRASQFQTTEISQGVVYTNKMASRLRPFWSITFR